MMNLVCYFYEENTIEPKKLAIVDSPNADKSVIFNTLTKRYVSVSNHPGTTVEVMRGKAGLSLVLDLNFMDEAQKLRVKIDLSGFEAKVDVPVVATIATEEREMNLLKKRRTYA